MLFRSQKTCFEDTEQRAADSHLCKGLGETHADEDDAEADADEGEPICWSSFGEDEVTGDFGVLARRNHEPRREKEWERGTNSRR